MLLKGNMFGILPFLYFLPLDWILKVLFSRFKFLCKLCVLCSNLLKIIIFLCQVKKKLYLCTRNQKTRVLEHLYNV